MLRFALISSVLLTTAYPVSGQASNRETYEALALECFRFIDETRGDVMLDAPARMPYVRSAIVSRLRGQGRQVFSADSTYNNQPENLPTLSYTIDDARVTYERIKKKNARRNVVFTTTTRLTASNGMLLADQVCNRQFADTVDVSDLASLESSSYAETQAPRPAAGFLRRYLQPLTLAAATVLTVYLFFTLRSETSSDGS